MDSNRLAVFALPSLNLGYHNQILGAFRALSDLTGLDYNDQAFLLPEGVNQTSELKTSLFETKHETYHSLKQKIFPMLDKYFQKTHEIPHIFITVYDATDGNFSAENIDIVCRLVKEYYLQNKLGEVFTVILTSRLHKYKYIDLINVPKHMLTFRTRIRLLQNRALKKKVLVTVGTINNFSRHVVLEKHKELLAKLAEITDGGVLQKQCDKLKSYISCSKHIVFCLGGRVDGPEIVFGVNYGKKMLNDALRLSRCGYGVVFVNGPRTPNETVDYLYENTQETPNILFQNCKKIAKTDDDRNNWRIYSGKYEEQLKDFEKLGNIYPGILGIDNTLVVHSMDSYSGCETANAALPTAISSKGFFVDPAVRYDCHNLKDLLCPKYAIDWDEFVNIADHMGVEPKDLHPQILSSPLRVFAEAVLNRINKTKSKKVSRR